MKQFKKFAGALLCHVRPILIRRSLALLEFVCSTHSLNINESTDFTYKGIKKLEWFLQNPASVRR